MLIDLVAVLLGDACQYRRSSLEISSHQLRRRTSVISQMTSMLMAAVHR
jgi:hypothetical protein